MTRWVPIDKRLVRALPRGRAFTELEAAFCVTADYDNGATVTIRGYAALWGWSQGKVRRFLEASGVEIQYPQDTADRQNQRGAIMIQMAERSRSDNGEIKIIDSNWLASEAERSRSDNGAKTERSQIPTMDLDLKPTKGPLPAKNQPADSRLFTNWFCYAFERLEDDRYIFDGGKDGKLLSTMLKSVPLKELVAKCCHYLADVERFPKGRPTISGFKSSINKYPGHVNGQVDRYREIGLLPPDGVLLEDWRPWQE